MLGVYKEKKKLITEKITPKYFGACPLLGVNGTILIGHGMCSEKDLINAIKLAYKLFKDKYLRKITASIKKIS
jgi:fatty acid/phospholipid biosynthesis enzyme